VFIGIIFLDLIAAGFYLYDYFVALSVNGLMRLLEIRNTDEIRPILELVPVTTRSLPSMMLFVATSKGVLFLVINFVVLFSFSKTSWRVCEENSKVLVVKEAKEVKEIRTNLRRKPKPKPKPIQPPSGSVHDVNVIVNHIEPETDNNRMQTHYESQPPFNPNVRSERKQETHF
jgi:hypothetical protein